MSRPFFIGTAFAIPLLFAVYLYTAGITPSAVRTRPWLPVMRMSEFSDQTAFTDEKDAFVTFNVLTGKYTDSALGFSLTIPAGWERVGEKQMFRSPDEVSDKTYADRGGQLIAIETYPKPTKQTPFDWFIADENRLATLRETMNARVKDKRSFHYKAETEEGQLLGTAIDADDYILKIDCYHPATEDYSSDACSGTMIQVTDSLNFK